MRRTFTLAAVLAAALLQGCSEQPTAPDESKDSLTGTVRMNGEPVDFVMLVATGPDGKSASGPALPGGRYRIENPPSGELKFRFAAAPPGGNAPGPGGTPKTIPAKYFTDRNELSVKYSGGRQTYDIDLKP